MENCVSCTPQETTPVCTGGCSCNNNVLPEGVRDIRLIAPTRDTVENWVANDPIIPEGVFCLVKDRLFEGSIEYIVGEPGKKYSELMSFAGAPLSRTGAENHSPLAADGKSTLDPSWLPAATSSALGAVMTSTTGAAGKVPITASGSSTLDSSWLPVSTSGAANKIPIAGNSGTLDPSWLPDATSSTKGAVMASTTTAANNVVKADANGGLDGWKDAIIDAITADDGSGGLVTDNNGNLSVDFSQMPTDKFEALLKGLKMLVPLEADRDFYVNKSHASASDNTNDVVAGNVTKHRGDPDLPFLTIQGCVNYITQTYAVNNHDANIRIVGGTGGNTVTYTESVTLPTYTRTTGGIYITPAKTNGTDYDNVVVDGPVSASNGIVSTPFYATGGWWGVHYLTLHRTEHATTRAGQTVGLLMATGKDTTVYLRGCSFIQEMPDGETSLTDTESYGVRVISADNGSEIRLQHGIVPYTISTEKPASGSPSIHVINALRNGTIMLIRDTTDGGVTPDIDCSGSCDIFMNCRQGGTVKTYGSIGSLNVFNGTVTGRTYYLTQSSYIAASKPVNDDRFPGDTTGYIDTATYCWYGDS